jgi:MoaA/NifB/PqqE/SkfB family radical SAM enzyme
MISDKLRRLESDRSYVLKPSMQGKTLNIEITGKCNEECIYCEYSALGLHKTGKDIEPGLFYKVTSEAKELGITDVGLYITGEPFMNPHLNDYVCYLKKELKIPYVYISTNGIACTPKRLEEIAEAGIDSIKFSISGGNAKSFFQHHGRNAFQQVVDNVRYSYEYRLKNNLDYKLYMFSILTQYNVHEKEEIKNVFGSYTDEIVFLDAIASPYVKGSKEYLEVSGMGFEHSKQSVIPCPQLFERIVVNEDGYLCACCVSTRTGYTIIEDLNNMSLKEAYYGNAMTKVRQLHIDNLINGTICENCVFHKNGQITGLNPEFSSKWIGNIDCDITDEIKRRFGL